MIATPDQLSTIESMTSEIRRTTYRALEANPDFASFPTSTLTSMLEHIVRGTLFTWIDANPLDR